MACGKKCYKSKSIAKKQIKLLNKTSKSDKKYTESYYCEECSNWHITSFNKERGRKINRNKMIINDMAKENLITVNHRNCTDWDSMCGQCKKELKERKENK